MLILSPVLSKASGSLAGMTAAHNRGGMYLRQRSTPTNPATPEQTVVRNALAALSESWTQDLTQAQRDAWAVYVENQLFVNRLGEARSIPPLAAYIRSNVPRLQAGLAVVANAPTTYTLPSFGIPTAAVDEAATDNVDVSFLSAQGWNDEDGAALLVYLSRGQSDGIEFFRGPYRLAGTILGDSAAPPASPATLTSPFALTAGQRVFARYTVTRADGRLASPIYDSTIVVP